MIKTMIQELRETVAHFDALEQELSVPENIADSGKYRTMMKEYKRIAPIAEKYGEYCRTEQAMQEAEALMDDGDMELRQIAAEEYREKQAQLVQLADEIRILMLPHDPDDDRNVIMEIRSGAGGEEAALFSGVLFRMYKMYADRCGWQLELMDANETELGGYKALSFLLTGEGVYARLKYESGVHRVQRVPLTESQGRIQTSTATVAVLPEVEDVEIELNPADIRMETYRSSGAGGQHINKTDSAVRLIHLPTGMIAECQEERSQFKNRDKAMKMLRSRLYDQKKREQEEAISSARRGQVGTGDRSERIRTYNYPQGRVTDHRIGLTLYTLQHFLNGDMDPVLGALAAADAAQKLNQNTDGNDAARM